MIEIQNLSKIYGEFRAVDSISLSVPSSSVYAFLGPNGAGKTTTIRMLMGILVPTEGSAKILGLDCFEDRVAVKRKVGYLPDTPTFYDYLTGHEIITFIGEMQGLKRAAAKSRADQLIQEFTLDDAGEEFAINYSLGMKKKLALACALVHEPEVLILDEPINGLDPRSSIAIQEKLRALANEGRTIFLSTHLLDMAEKIADGACIIHQGKIQSEGSIGKIRSDVLPGGSLEEIFLTLTETGAT